MALVGHETDVVAVLRFELGLEFDDPAEVGGLVRSSVAAAAAGGGCVIIVGVPRCGYGL